jgi:hypothetical protein
LGFFFIIGLQKAQADIEWLIPLKIVNIMAEMKGKEQQTSMNGRKIIESSMVMVSGVLFPYAKYGQYLITFFHR